MKKKDDLTPEEWESISEILIEAMEEARPELGTAADHSETTYTK